MASPTARTALVLEGSVSIAAVVGGLLLVVAGAGYGLSSPTGIGPGTFPAAAGVLMTLSGVLQLPGLARQRAELGAAQIGPSTVHEDAADDDVAAATGAEDLLPDRQGLIRVAVVVVSTLAAAVLLNSLGFIIVVGLYLAVVLKVVGHRTWLRSALVGFLVAFIIGEGFSRLLAVALPQSPFPFLQQFGV